MKIIDRIIEYYFEYTFYPVSLRKKKNNTFCSHWKHFFPCKWNLKETNMIDKNLTSNLWQHLMQVHLLQRFKQNSFTTVCLCNNSYKAH